MQAEIMEVLRDLPEGRWVTHSEVVQLLREKWGSVNRRSTHKALGRLCKFGFLERSDEKLDRYWVVGFRVRRDSVDRDYIESNNIHILRSTGKKGINYHIENN